MIAEGNANPTNMNPAITQCKLFASSDSEATDTSLELTDDHRPEYPTEPKWETLGSSSFSSRLFYKQISVKYVASRACAVTGEARRKMIGHSMLVGRCTF